jgi:hypothetical protein
MDTQHETLIIPEEHEELVSDAHWFFKGNGLGGYEESHAPLIGPRIPIGRSAGKIKYMGDDPVPIGPSVLTFASGVCCEHWSHSWNTKYYKTFLTSGSHFITVYLHEMYFEKENEKHPVNATVGWLKGWMKEQEETL